MLAGLGGAFLLAAPSGWAPSALAAASHGIEGAPSPTWPDRPKARGGAPNVLVIMTDDVGFGASSTFGGPVPTATFDVLAATGLRYNAFHTTAICSPSRAALLTGRNPHAVGMGNATNLATGFEGYTTVIPRSAGTVAQVLVRNGYSTAAFGKWHLTPEWEQGMNGPFDRWPSGLGFEYFYGFIGHDSSMFEPALVENNAPRERPAGDAHYHFDRDMADHAITWIRQQQAETPDKPFLAYYAPGTAHAPHHAPPEWLEKFRGRFDEGWDLIRQRTFERQKAAGIIPANAVLPPRPPEIPAWSSLPDDQKRFAARLMEAHAAALSYADFQMGRVIDAIRETGELDNTLIVYIQGDNGASAEGGINGLLFEQSMINGTSEDPAYQKTRIDDIGGSELYNTYPVGWTWAMNTPFRYYKRVASHLGGIRNGMVISWPARIKDGEGGVRPQFHHLNDVMPTILEAAGVTPPASMDGVQQKQLDGVSMSYSFGSASAPPRRTLQVFEMMENFGIYQDGWMAVSTPTTIPWAPEKSAKPPVDERGWELYDLNTDYSQSRDLAASRADKLKELQAAFWQEAEKGHILPIHRFNEGTQGMPTLAGDRTVFTYRPGVIRVPEMAAPDTLRRSFGIEARLTVPPGGAEGVIVTHGGRFGGYGLYMRDGKLVFHYNALDPYRYTVETAVPLAQGEHAIAADFVSDGGQGGPGGTVTLRVDGKTLATGRVDKTITGGRINPTEGLDVGRDSVTPVSDDYTIEGSKFSGRIDSVTITLK
ncbi:MAG: arylsulfatase [Sphingomonadales bacterium]